MLTFCDIVDLLGGMFLNNVDTINILIKRLRTEKKLTQFQISNLLKIPSSTYAMIESGHRSISNDILTQLSIVLDFDLVTFSQKIHNYNSLEHYLLATELIQLSSLNKVDEISYIFKTSPIINEFTYGEPHIIKTYCEILVLVGIENNIDLVYTTCIDFLKIKKLEDFQPKMNMPNKYYSIILNLEYCLYLQKMYDETITINKAQIDFLENLYFKSDFPFMNVPSFHKKYYIICLNNLAEVLFTLKDFDNALQICNKGIAKSNSYNVLSILPMLLKLKVEILCTLENYSEAKSTYIQYKVLCEITDKLDYLEASTIKFRTMYPNLSNE